MLDMVSNFGVNMFKVDGVSFGAEGVSPGAYASQVCDFHVSLRYCPSNTVQQHGS